MNVLRHVAKILRIDPESAFDDAENTGINEKLLDQQTVEATGLAILGGVIATTEENTLKRLLFRSTKGHAMLHTFDLTIDDADVLLDEAESGLRLRGYFVLFEDGHHRRTVTRVCKSFMGSVYETSFQSVISDLQEAKGQKASVRLLISQSKMNFVNYLTQYNPLKD